jgi:hypothetical protein
MQFSVVGMFAAAVYSGRGGTLSEHRLIHVLVSYGINFFTKTTHEFAN